MKKYIFTFVILLYQLTFSNIVAPPIANMIGDQAICDEGPAIDGIEYFDLTLYNAQILDGNPLPLSNYTVEYFLTQSDALNDTNTIANPVAFSGADGQTIYVRVTNITTSEFSLTYFGLMVFLPPQTLMPTTLLTTCDTDFNDGYLSINLDSYKPTLLNGLSASLYSIVFYPSLADASNFSNPIANPTNYVTETGSVYYVCYNNATLCLSISYFNVVIEQQPTPVITNEVHTICVDYLTNSVENTLVLESTNLTSYLNAPQVPVPTYAYQWYMDGVAIAGANSPTFLIASPLSDNSSAVFSVQMYSTSAGSCVGTSQDFIVNQSGQASPIGIGYSIVNNSGNQTITVEVQGYGVYQYSLDGGPRQDSPIFENVTLGTHSITVWDTEGGLNYSCNPLVLSNVEVVAGTTPPPTGNVTQSFNQGATLADIQVSGENIRWYATDVSVTTLPMNTVLVNGSTYYATQKIGGYESVNRLAVTVQTNLNTIAFSKNDFSVVPNPIHDFVRIQSNDRIRAIEIYNLLGQLVYIQNANDTELILYLQHLKSGNYVAKIQSENHVGVIKLTKN